MADSSSKLIFQGALSLSYSPQSNSKSATPPKKKKPTPSSTSSYSVLHLDGRLECYPGDPFSVGSAHEACKPIHTLHLNPFNHWSLISIPAKSPLPYPFTVSRKPPLPTSPPRSQTNLTHLGLDVETLGSQLSSAENNKSKDRKSLKQRIGFGPKRTANKKYSDPSYSCPRSPPPLSEDTSIPHRPTPYKTSSFMSKLGSPSSSVSLPSSINMIDLPNSLTFSTHSESSRKQWIDAFIKVFRSATDLELASQQLYRSISQTSPVDLYTLKTRASPTLPSVSSHVVTVTPAGSPKKKTPSGTPSLTEHIPASSSHSDYCISPPPLSCSTSPGMNGTPQVKIAEAVPAWIKAVRNADDKRLEQDVEFSQSEVNPQVSSETGISSKPQSPIDMISRENSIDQAPSRQASQGPFSHSMSHSFSAPGPLSSAADQHFPRGPENSKALPTVPMKSFGTSVVQNLKRAGSLTDWPDFSNAGQSILQRMRENDNQSVLSDSPMSSSPIVTQDPVECSDSNSARTKRAWLLHMVKKSGSAEKSKGSLNSYSSASLLASTSATHPSSRAARHGIYMLKGVSSNSSLASSSHQIVTSSRESDGQHSLHQVLNPGTDSDQGHRSHQSDQTLPQLPNKLSQSTRKFPSGQSKQVFSEWLTTTSSQAALRLGQSSKTEFGPTHSKSRSLASSPWSHLPSHSSLGSNGFSLPKLNPKLADTRELGLNIMSPNGGLSRSVYQMRLSSETSSSFGQEDLPPIGNRSSPTTTSDISQSPPSQSPDHVIQVAKELDRATALSKFPDSYARDNEKSSDFSPVEDTHNESFQSRTNQSNTSDKNLIETDNGGQIMTNKPTSASAEKNLVNNFDSSSKENSFEFLSSEPPTSSTWSSTEKSNRVTMRGRTHTIGALCGGPHKGYEINNGTISIPSLPVPPGRRKNNKSLGNTNSNSTQVKKDNLTPEDNYGRDHHHRPLKESRLKFNSTGDEKNQNSKMKINGSKIIMTGIEGEFGK